MGGRVPFTRQLRRHVAQYKWNVLVYAIVYTLIIGVGIVICSGTINPLQMPINYGLDPPAGLKKALKDLRLVEDAPRDR